MRDWTKTLLPASFKGVPFFIEKESVSEGGRHVVVHEYVRSERHDTEDMGRKPRKFQVTAYLASDGADAQAQALLMVTSSKGPGPLVLPVLGVQFVSCTGPIRSSSDKSKLGYVGFEMEFVEAMAGFSFPVVFAAASVALSAAASVASRIATTLTLR